MTNSEGARAWILTPTESAAWQQKMKTTPGVSVLSSPAIQTLSGGQASVGVGNAPPFPGAPSTGITVNVIPKARSDSIRLMLNATATELATPQTNVASVRTNFAAVCEAIVPNGGCLVLDAGPSKGESGQRSWMVFSPVLVDGQGRPIKR